MSSNCQNGRVNYQLLTFKLFCIGDQDDRALFDMIPFLEHLADPRLDVRRELDRYGHEDPASKFAEVQTARRSAIMQQREKGFGGMLDKMSANKTSSMPPMNQEMGFPSKFGNNE